MSTQTLKGYKGMNMEGGIATWYARNTARSMEQFRAEALRLAGRLQPGARVLEVAPGPGYLAVELARLGDFVITGLDVSHKFVEIALGHARAAGVEVDFRQGDATHMPFADSSFDFLVCRAAFKNFAFPAQVLGEMHRVLAPGGVALINDLRRDATRAEISTAVDAMALGRINATMTRWIFRTSLLKRAYTRAEMERMVGQSPFGECSIEDDSIGMNVWLHNSH